ncbi:bifunctional methylenetetrahydrofolate dehydrogenase/methenyltetrahydrofolate cyclohydrolase FolD [Erythrobacter sp.]|jgi:methylenetetrahydrofolate dehydrogenase (NADP+)/methenyltetrahydrofolate cyclohydrolase|uniref:bifunctional methylenetetrahydrofolate dehydrogenase/methenyltetrahydrofolate cyclohydrolase FolD n=1 Tax=Erythrobacter sp. TaxID=1042 RepID=UPI002EB258F7|nr:bifunctional methylenetetrahydrofolate dehydrogenase/methenyltetrahydrofolate cyclohydrolase FolD [Erythrobacter sp.]
MSAERIDGKAFAAKLRERVGAQANTFAEQTGRKPGLAVVLVGEDPASEVYVRAKGKATIAAGMASFEHRLAADTDQQTLIDLVERLNADEAVDGILVQLPLPKHLDEKAVIATIDPNKDVDGITPTNAGRLVLGMDTLVSCTPLGCLLLLRDLFDDLSGLDAVVIGRSILFGKPMAQLLLSENCTVTMAHSRTRDLKSLLRRADIVVAAVGVPNLIRGDWLKPGSVVLDGGINRLDPEPGEAKGRIVGDVAYDEATEHVRAITPVPGGVGATTIAVLLRNTLVAAYRNEGLEVLQDL